MYNKIKLHIEMYDILGKVVNGNLELFKDNLVLVPSFFIYKKLFQIYLNIFYLIKNKNSKINNIYEDWE